MAGYCAQLYSWDGRHPATRIRYVQASDITGPIQATFIDGRTQRVVPYRF